MLVVQGGVLELEVLEFFVLLVAIRFEELGKVVNPLADLLVQFVELGLGAFLQFFQLHLQFALLFPLALE